MKLEDINTGESWACKFRVSTFLNEDGNPVTANLNVGDKHPGKPGSYESIGLIKVRDKDKKLVQLIDTKSQQEFCVSWEDCWDVDTVEWIDDEAMA